jgi:hypothetical protein
LQLFRIAHALDTLGPGLGVGQGRQQHGRQNGDDRDHHQELDESKGGFTVVVRRIS